MKHFALIVLFIAFLSVCVQAQLRLELKNKTVKDDLLVEILNDSEMKELKPPSPNASAVFLRLFSIGVLGDCAPEVETEVTCSFRYYLAASDGGLGVPRAVYDLGEVGEIIKIQWLENSQSDTARLRLEISNFPELAFRDNPKLLRKTKTVELFVSINSLKIKAIN
jgi:hypothetical protein